jgi:CDP-2,3-bis-(O-geranylgeranyl)-sn-glycerol synthase
MLPAYIPNSAAVAFGGGAPIDFGKNFSDGRRIFGDGKTWRGFIVGSLAGILVGILLIVLQDTYALTFLPGITLAGVILFAVGALLGDLVKSFIKRRLGKPSGSSWLVADQYDLVAGAFVMAAVFDAGWFFSVMTLPIFIAVLIITPVLHRVTNMIGYAAGVKKVPW